MYFWLNLILTIASTQRIAVCPSQSSGRLDLRFIATVLIINLYFRICENQLKEVCLLEALFYVLFPIALL